MLEARDRIGGRVHTLRPPGWPVPLEAGAEFVHGRPKVLLPLAREARAVRGGHYSGAFERQDDLWNSVMEKLEKLPSARERTVAEALRTLRRRLRTTPEERQLAADFLEGFNAARLDRASLKAIVQQLRASARIEGVHIWFAAHEVMVHKPPKAFGDIMWVLIDENPLDAFLFGCNSTDPEEAGEEDR